MVARFCKQSLYFSGLPLIFVYFINPVLLPISLWVVLSLMALTFTLVLTTSLILKKTGELHPLISLKLMVLKFLGAGVIFIIFFLLHFHSKAFALVFTSSYFIQTILFGVFLSGIKSDQSSDTQ